MKKDILTGIEVVVMIIALFVLGAEADNLALFISSKVLALAAFCFCAWDLIFLCIKKPKK